MTRRYFLIPAMVMIAAAAATSASKTTATIDGRTAFSSLKGLVGNWEANSSMGKVQVSYELIAGGTALVERESAEHMPSMMTVYHFDGERLLLTHYCMAGNQPRMQARAFDAAAGKLDFQFVDATNLADANAGHMHNARFRFIDADHFAADWDFYEGGKVKQTESFEYVRVR